MGKSTMCSNRAGTKIILMMTALIFILVVLAACASTQPSDVISTESMTSPLPSVFTPEATFEPTLEPTEPPTQGSQYDPVDGMLILKAVECDFDGDGTKETATLKIDEAEYGSGIVLADIASGNIDLQETLELAPFMKIDETISVDLDGDGGEELMIVANTGASGGWGGKSLMVLTLDNGSIRQLRAGGLCGFSVTGKLLPQFQAEITVTETGSTLVYPFVDELYFMQEGYYSESGELLKDAEVSADGICSVHLETGIVEIGQFLWTDMHTNGNEFLVSELTFDKNGYEVVSQRIETSEYIRQFVRRG